MGPDAKVLEVSDLRYSYGTADGSLEAISQIGFTVDNGEFVSIVGPSGSGKTTLLKILSGLLRATSGAVYVSGKAVAGEVPPEVALVFQDYSRSLFPWMTVQANVEFPLVTKRMPKVEVKQRSRESIEAVGLLDFSQRYPWELSGGMQQRVAIARAVAYRPRVLLMDEPFASVDAQTRADLEDLIASVHQRFGTTILFVTHDIDESVYLSDRVLTLSGRPARLLRDVAVPLPRPRDQVYTRELPAFVHLRTEIASLIRSRGETTERRPTTTVPDGV